MKTEEQTPASFKGSLFFRNSLIKVSVYYIKFSFFFFPLGAGLAVPHKNDLIPCDVCTWHGGILPCLWLPCVWGEAQRPNGNMMFDSHEQMFLAKPWFCKTTVNFCQSRGGGRNQKLVWYVCVCICVFESVSIYMCVCVLMCVWLCFWMYVNVWVCVCMRAYVCSCVCVSICVLVYMCECVMVSNIAQRLSGKFGSHIVLISHTDSIAPSLSMWHGSQPLWHKSLIYNSDVIMLPTS